jgi:hypothetical protein
VVSLAHHRPVGGVSGIGYADHLGNGHMHGSTCHSSEQELKGEGNEGEAKVSPFFIA